VHASDENKIVMRTSFGKFVHDDSALVRQEAAKKIGSLAQVLEREHVADLIPMLKTLSNDEKKNRSRVRGHELCLRC